MVYLKSTLSCQSVKSRIILLPYELFVKEQIWSGHLPCEKACAQVSLSQFLDSVYNPYLLFSAPFSSPVLRHSLVQWLQAISLLSNSQSLIISQQLKNAIPPFWLMAPYRTFWKQWGVFLPITPALGRLVMRIRCSCTAWTTYWDSVLRSQNDPKTATTSNCNFQDPDRTSLLQGQTSVTPLNVILHCLPYSLEQPLQAFPLSLTPNLLSYLCNSIGLHYGCAYSPEPVSDIQHILSDEPTQPLNGNMQHSNDYCSSSCMEEDNDGFSGRHQFPWQLWLLSTDSMLAFSTVLLLNVLASTSHLWITVISLEKQRLCKVSKCKRPSIRSREWKTHLKKQKIMASAVTVHWACQTCLIQFRNIWWVNNVLFFPIRRCYWRQPWFYSHELNKKKSMFSWELTAKNKATEKARHDKF